MDKVDIYGMTTKEKRELADELGLRSIHQLYEYYYDINDTESDFDLYDDEDIEIIDFNVEEEDKRSQEQKKLIERMQTYNDIISSRKKISASIFSKIGKKLFDFAKQKDIEFENCAEIYGKKAQEYANGKKEIMKQFNSACIELDKQYREYVTKYKDKISAWQFIENKQIATIAKLTDKRTTVMALDRTAYSYYKDYVEKSNPIKKEIQEAVANEDVASEVEYRRQLLSIQETTNIYRNPIYKIDLEINSAKRDLKSTRGLIAAEEKNMRNNQKEYEGKLIEIKNKTQKEMTALDKSKFWEKIISKIYKPYNGLKKFKNNVADSMTDIVQILNEAIEAKKEERIRIAKKEEEVRAEQAQKEQQMEQAKEAKGEKQPEPKPAKEAKEEKQPEPKPAKEAKGEKQPEPKPAKEAKEEKQPEPKPAKEAKGEKRPESKPAKEENNSKIVNFNTEKERITKQRERRKSYNNVKNDEEKNNILVAMYLARKYPNKSVEDIMYDFEKYLDEKESRSQVNSPKVKQQKRAKERE